MAMGSNNRFLGLFLLTISMLILEASASSRTTPYTFYVGGIDGWVIKPSEGYSHWAQRLRFQVNDTLYFKYEQGSDSVLVVNEEDYKSCNPNNPIHKMDNGDSTFVFDKSGPFFFISGNVENCQRGQKLIVVVLALTHHQHSHLPPPAAPPSETPSTAEAEAPTAANVLSPRSNVVPSGQNNLAPSPAKHSDSTRVRVSVGVALGVSVGMGFVLQHFGLVCLSVCLFSS